MFKNNYSLKKHYLIKWDLIIKGIKTEEIISITNTNNSERI
jgi:hypothetical protein